MGSSHGGAAETTSADSKESAVKEASTNDGSLISNADAGPMAAFNDLVNGERPSLRWLFLMLMIEFTGFAMLIPILPFFLMKELGLGPQKVGLLLSAFSIAQLIGSWGCGRLSDSVGRRPVILGVFAWAGVGFAATAFVTSFIEVLIVRAAQGLSGGTAALCDAFVLDLVPERSRGSYMGLAGGFKGMAFVIGPGLGVLMTVIGMDRRHIFLVSGAMAWIACVLGVVFLKESLDYVKRRPLCSGGQDDKTTDCDLTTELEGINRELLLVWHCRLFSALGLGFLFATYSFLIKDNFGWADAEFGMVLFFSGLLTAFLQVAVFPVVVAKVGASRTLLMGALFAACSYILMPMPSLVVHVIALVLFTAGGASLEPSLPVLIGQFTGERHLGFANGVTASCRALATMLSPLIAGSLYEMGPKHAYYSGAGCFMCAFFGAAALACCARTRSSETDTLLVKGGS